MTQALNITETGRRAFAAGVNPKQNPFAVGSAAASLWAKGFRQARESKEREDKKAQDVFARALRADTLDAALKIIMDALGIKTGDVAGQCFSKRDAETYEALVNGYRRAEFLKSWLSSELDDAAERVGQNG